MYKEPLPEIGMAKEGPSFSYTDQRLKGHEYVATVVPGRKPIFSESTTRLKAIYIFVGAGSFHS